jgi:hypothetical protein
MKNVVPARKESQMNAHEKMDMDRFLREEGPKLDARVRRTTWRLAFVLAVVVIIAIVLRIVL